MQENKLEDLLNEMSSFEEVSEQEEAEEIDENVDEEEYFERSYSQSSIQVEYENEETEYDQDGFESDRSDYEEPNDTSPVPVSPSPVHEDQNSRIPPPPPPRRAVMPENVTKKERVPIPGHVFSQTRVAPESKVKIFQEKLPNYNKVIGSTGYGNNTNKRAPLSYVRKPSQVILPPLQQNTQNQSQHLSSNEGSHHHDFTKYDESFTIKQNIIKGIVKPNLTRKDLMKLRDPTVRPRGASKQTTQETEQEIVVRGSVKYQQGLKLPMIPQPPPRPNNNNKINASVGSRIPRLPTIQQHQAMSGIPRPCPPQPPTMSCRPQPRASHRRYVARDTGLPFPRRH